MHYHSLARTRERDCRRYQDRRDKRLAYAKTYYETHRDTILERQRTRRAARLEAAGGGEGEAAAGGQLPAPAEAAEIGRASCRERV